MTRRPARVRSTLIAMLGLGACTSAPLSTAASAPRQATYDVVITGGRIVDGNQALASMVGYTVPDFCQLQIADFFYPDDAAAALVPVDVTGARVLVPNRAACISTSRRPTIP